MHSLSHIIRFISDTLFPPSHDELLVRHATLRDLVFLMQQERVHDVTALLPFYIPLVRAAVHEAKFHGNKKACALLGNVLHEYLFQLPKHEYVLIPVPLSASRKRQRGYNQAAEIAKAALQNLPHIKICENILKRTRNTKPQTDLPKEKREENVKDAFKVIRPEAIAGKRIILFDDVVTTGATLNAAKAALLKYSPASITLIALAH